MRVAKELVKFNERCFVRLLGDMRSYNFVFVVTPDFEDVQLRIRAMDFDQQTYNGRKNFYRPQFFKENSALALFCASHLRLETANQYQREEQTLILQRAESRLGRLGLLLEAMARDPISPPGKGRAVARRRWPSTTGGRNTRNAPRWAPSSARTSNRSGGTSAGRRSPPSSTTRARPPYGALGPRKPPQRKMMSMMRRIRPRPPPP